MHFFLKYIALLGLITILSSSCRKDKFIKDSDAKLEFSNDTVLFDTVFTTLGSTTQQLKVYNPYSKKIKISSIRLKGSAGRQYRINIDGDPVSRANDIEIEPKDSLFIFVEVTVDPLNSNAPLVVEDEILFETNGNQQSVKLVAWGQDAIYYYPTDHLGQLTYSVIPCNTVWTKDKPIVIFGYAVVDSACTLTIEKGTQIHFNASAGLWVYKNGTIKVNGTKEEQVVFQGLRLEHDYDDIWGQWDRIWINENGMNANYINYAVIKNSYIGIQPEILNTKYSGDVLTIKNTIIKNCSGWGVFARAYEVNCENVLISNCQKNAVALLNGGTYNFINTTIANYPSVSKGQRKDASVFMNNTGIDLTARFVNSIVYGSIEKEIELDEQSGKSFTYLFENCILRTELNTSASSFVNVKANTDPVFKDLSKKDYHLSTGSPAIDAGTSNSLTGIFIPPTDLDNKNRVVPVDIGCYEYVP